MSENVKKSSGRPVIPGSKRQIRLAAKAARIAAGEEVKRGRPTNPESKNAKRKAAKAARIAAGEEVKVGRPKKSVENLNEGL